MGWLEKNDTVRLGNNCGCVPKHIIVLTINVCVSLAGFGIARGVRIVWLSAEGVTPIRDVASRKLRLSATATNAARLRDRTVAPSSDRGMKWKALGEY